jgi:hypothetical protein
MADASRSELPRRAALGVVDTWRRLNFEQRVAGVGALLLLVSTFGPFSFVEAAIVLTGLSVLWLLRKRAEGREFHIPFGDGSVIATAGAWSGLLIAVRLFDRPLGQNLLALVCAGVLLIAGVAERRKRPPDDLPGPAPEAHQRGPETVDWEEPSERVRQPRGRAQAAGSGAAAADDDATEPLGQPRPRVGAGDAPTEVGRRRRRSRTAGTEEATESLPAESGEAQQLELSPAPPVNDPLPPPEFHLPGDDELPPPERSD